jgi:hypothetical protein
MTMLLCAFNYTKANTKLFINEFMASNSSTYATEQGEYEDWIELYNGEDTAIDLANYYITDNLSNLTKHRFNAPKGSLIIPAKGFLIIWADGNTSLGFNHAGFSLSADGESVALVAPDGTSILDQFTFSAQKPDYSMGRTNDGGETWAYLKPASPKSSNVGATAYQGILSPPVFDVKGGVFASPIEVKIGTNEMGAQIIYTLDGSIPDLQNAQGEIYRYKNNYSYTPSDPAGSFLQDTSYTFVYTQSIPITNRDAEPNRVSNKSSNFAPDPSAYLPVTPVRKATVIRARAVKPGYVPSDIEANTYFITNTPNIGYSFPIFSLSLPQKYFYDWDTGIYNAGKDFEIWRAANPGATAALSAGANWHRDTEFPLSLEYFSANTGERLVHHNAGFRIHGSGSSLNPQKSLRLYFRSDYGKSEFGYPVFPNEKATDFKRLVLRNNGTEFGSIFEPQSTYIRDMALQTAVRQLKFATQLSTPSIVFVNGEYWGIHILYERYDRFYFEQKYGIKEGELDLIEIRDGVSEGDDVHYNKMLNFIKSQDVSSPLIYDSVNRLMDVDNYIDFQATEIYFGNSDWPHNNMRYFRKRTTFYDSLAPYAQDGRWRWVLYDLDRAAGDSYFSFDKLASVSTVPHTYNAILGRLLLNDVFREKFITRYLDLSNTVFKSQYVNHIIDSLKALLLPEMPEHIRRWRSTPPSLNTWNSDISRVISFINKRPEHSLKHLQQRFNTDSAYSITLNLNNITSGFIKINTLDIYKETAGVGDQPYPWTGIYLAGVPITLKPVAKPGYRFVKWEGDTTSTEEILILRPKQFSSVSITAVFEPDPLFATEQILYYWHFNNLPSGNLDNIIADSAVKSGSNIHYAGIGDGYMDRTNATDGSELNTQYNTISGQALRVRNPSDTRSLIISTPSTGFKNIAISYAVQRTNNGAQLQRISYSPDNGTSWKIIKDNVEIEEDFALLSFDLTDSVGAENNENLQFKIEFLGSNSAGSSGNNRFDNLLISGVKLETACTPGEWLGTVNNDWFNPANWCGAVPSTTDEVVIGPGKPNYPVVTANNSITIKSLNLLPGSTINLLQNVQLTVEGGKFVVKGNIFVGENSKVNIK